MAYQISGQIIVTTAGTAVPGPSVQGNTFKITFDPRGSGYGFVGNDGEDDVADGTGDILSPGNVVVVKPPGGSLASMRFDASVNDSKFTFLRLD